MFNPDWVDRRLNTFHYSKMTFKQTKETGDDSLLKLRGKTSTLVLSGQQEPTTFKTKIRSMWKIPIKELRKKYQDINITYNGSLGTSV